MVVLRERLVQVNAAENVGEFYIINSAAKFNLSYELEMFAF